MSPSLTYAPAYVGLFLSLVLSIACNAYLDIQYGSFGIEVIVWGFVFAWTLWIGWRQQGQVNEAGKQKQKMVLLVGGLLFILIFVPIWGFPRAGLYMLAVLQASNNCISTTRRELHLGLLVSAVMVIFAASHYRADWTLLFYLLPYVTAVVTTLVAEQVSRRAQDLRQESLGRATAAGQSTAIVAATAVILLLGASLYAITPQLTWPYLHWRYGQLSSIGLLGGSPEQGGGGSSNDQQSHRPSEAGSMADGSGDSDAGQRYDQLPGSGWPTPKQMREAAGRPGMPGWQSSTIVQMADLGEAMQNALAPLLDALEKMSSDLKDWLKEHRSETLAGLFGLLLLVILIAFARLLREANVVMWSRARFDYLRFGMLGWHSGGNPAARQYYEAMETLFALGEMPRSVATNTREYLRQMTLLHRDLRHEITELTLLFEQSRYGKYPLDERQICRMREIYRQIYQKAGR